MNFAMNLRTSQRSSEHLWLKIHEIDCNMSQIKTSVLTDIHRRHIWQHRVPEALHVVTVHYLKNYVKTLFN
jgi:hypothetical protein